MKDTPALRCPQSAYSTADGVLYLPDYRVEGLYVGPGGKKYHPSTLEKCGCEVLTLNLWHRDYVDPRTTR